MITSAVIAVHIEINPVAAKVSKINFMPIDSTAFCRIAPIVSLAILRITRIIDGSSSIKTISAASTAAAAPSVPHRNSDIRPL